MDLTLPTAVNDTNSGNFNALNAATLLMGLYLFFGVRVNFLMMREGKFSFVNAFFFCL